MKRIQYKNKMNNFKHVTRCPTGVMCLMITCICAVSTNPQSMQTHHPMPDGCGVHDDHMHMGVKKPTSAQVRKCASVQVCKCASVQVRKRASVQARKCVQCEHNPQMRPSVDATCTQSWRNFQVIVRANNSQIRNSPNANPQTQIARK